MLKGAHAAILKHLPTPYQLYLCNTRTQCKNSPFLYQNIAAKVHGEWKNVKWDCYSLAKSYLVLRCAGLRADRRSMRFWKLELTNGPTHIIGLDNGAGSRLVNLVTPKKVRFEGIRRQIHWMPTGENSSNHKKTHLVGHLSTKYKGEKRQTYSKVDYRAMTKHLNLHEGYVKSRGGLWYFIHKAWKSEDY